MTFATLDRNPKRRMSVVPTAKNSETIIFIAVVLRIVAPLWTPIKGKSLRDSWGPLARNLGTIIRDLPSRTLYTVIRKDCAGNFTGMSTDASDSGGESSDYMELQEVFPKSSRRARVVFYIWEISW